MLAAYHNRLSLVLYDVTRPADLIATAQTVEEKLIGWVDGLVAARRHGSGLTFRGHDGAGMERRACGR